MFERPPLHSPEALQRSKTEGTKPIFSSKKKGAEKGASELAKPQAKVPWSKRKGKRKQTPFFPIIVLVFNVKECINLLHLFIVPCDRKNENCASERERQDNCRFGTTFSYREENKKSRRYTYE